MRRIMEDSKMETQAPIIFGQDLVSTYGILNYNIEPDKFRAVEPPAPAPEEFVVNDERCVLPFSAAMLDAASLSDLTTTSNLRAQSMAAIGKKRESSRRAISQAGIMPRKTMPPGEQAEPHTERWIPRKERGKRGDQPCLYTTACRSKAP